MTVDDEPHVLNAIERDLKERYYKDYRIIKVESGTKALEILEQLKRRNELIALFLVDQRMPGLSGIEFIEKAIVHLREAIRINPDLAEANINLKKALSLRGNIN